MKTALGGRSSLPNPGECSNSDFSGPPILFWSAWLELGGAINKVPVLRLNTNSAYCSKIFQLQSCTRSTSCSFTPQTPSFKFPFPNEFLEVNLPELFFSWNEQPQLSTLGTFINISQVFLGQLSLNEPPDLIPLSWGIMTPNVGRLPPTT